MTTGQGSVGAQADLKLQEDPDALRGQASVAAREEQIERLIEERVAARKSKNFAEADRIRKELLDAGIVLEDTPQGTTWRRG
jgi:cysteinyl-tRNA synthetase